MMKMNCFECELTCYDSMGMEIDITELPIKARREIANAIVNGNKYGTFSPVVVQEELLSELKPAFVHELSHVCDMHRNAVFSRALEREERAKALAVIQQQQEQEEQEDA